MIKHKITETKLKSGAKLIYIKTPGSPLSVISAWYRVGSRFDPNNKEGLAHFFEHILMSTATKSFPNKQEKMKLIDSLGINANAGTGKEFTYFYHSQPVEKTYESLSLLLETLSNTDFKSEDIEHEKSIILDEISRDYDHHQGHVRTLTSSALWPKNKIGRSILGSEKSVSNINLKDVSNFKKDYYTADNTIFVIVGDLDLKKIKKIIDQEYTVPTRKKKIPKEKLKKQLPIVIEKRKTNNIAVSISYLAPAITKREEMFKMSLLNHYLSGGWVGKLMSNLRIKNNLTYGVSGTNIPFSDTGFISFNFTVTKKNLPKALTIFFETIESIKNDREDDSLEGVKTSYISEVLHGTIVPTSMLTLCGYFAILNQKVVTPEEEVKKIKALKLADIRKTASKYLKASDFSVAAIGNITEKEMTKYLKKLV